MSDVENLEDLLDRLVEKTDGETITLSDLMGTVESRSFGPLLLLPSFIALSPLGAIPGMSVITGTMIILIASQLLLNRKHPWLPSRLMSISFKREKLSNGTDKIRPWAKWVDQWLAKRWTMLTKTPFSQIVAGLAILLALTFYPLALIPWGVAIPSGAIVLFSLGLTSRDGLFVFTGLVTSCLALYATYEFWPF
ncbi:exopolysaccharide biosynthesis protein [Rubinisphaera margarita]|uniref:exopolysaccharide biosynthesis protein n=1 Tax=Rubinisphaera margarita TaxID=2909586 RepID=UPI001EE8F995|nr:exopolysaccharide biosynthesis protein [Rubinisphaera margarita]MCG6156413.1 exopolysaccharide biosynthesis protein [Rubinisphaera margarita]